MSNDEDVIGELVALGVIVLIGVGLYKIISSFGSFENGDEATKKEVLNMNQEQLNPNEVDICMRCGTKSPERCSNDHCMVCDGDSSGTVCDSCND